VAGERVPPDARGGRSLNERPESWRAWASRGRSTVRWCTATRQLGTQPEFEALGTDIPTFCHGGDLRATLKTLSRQDHEQVFTDHSVALKYVHETMDEEMPFHRRRGQCVEDGVKVDIRPQDLAEFLGVEQLEQQVEEGLTSLEALILCGSVHRVGR
jgi:hypothetical protein